MAKEPIFEYTRDRQAYEAPEHTVLPNAFDRPRGRVTQPGMIQGETRPKNWAEQDLRKMIYSAIADKKVDGKTTTELARKALWED